MKMVSKENDIKVINRGLIIVLIVSALAHLATGIASFLEKPRETYLPPDLSRGTIVQPGEVPEPYVYSFANMVFQSINSWSNGQTDYINRINDNSRYLSTAFRNELENDYQRLLSRHGINELSKRSRTLTLSEAYPYSPDSVEALIDGQWAVTLVYHITEYVGKTPVKNTLMQIPLTVLKTTADPKANEFGLKIAGFSGNVERLTEVQ